MYKHIKLEKSQAKNFRIDDELGGTGTSQEI